jgi:hypothetical protein
LPIDGKKETVERLLAQGHPILPKPLRRALAGMRLCVAHPDQGLIHRPTNGGHCGGDGSVLRLRAAVARTNWRGLAA